MKTKYAIIKLITGEEIFSQVEEFKAAGADEVIPEEFETSIEIFCRVLKDYRIPNNIIEQQVELIHPQKVMCLVEQDLILQVSQVMDKNLLFLMVLLQQV